MRMFYERALTLCRFRTLLTCVFLLMEHYSQQKTLASALHLHLSYTFGFHEDPSHLVLALRCNDYLTALGRTTKGRHRISCPKQESHLVPCTGWCKWCKRLYFISLLAKTHLKRGGGVGLPICYVLPLGRTQCGSGFRSTIEFRETQSPS